MAKSRMGEELPDLSIGDFVQIHGLQSAKDLNGRKGQIVVFKPETCRFGVRLEGEDEPKAVKPENLIKCEPVVFEAPPIEVPEPTEEEKREAEKQVLERHLQQVIYRIKTMPDSEEKHFLQRDLQDLYNKLKKIEEEEMAQMEERAKLAMQREIMQNPGPIARPPVVVAPMVLEPPPPPREQHHPLPPRIREPLREVRPEPRLAPIPRPQPPPLLPERPVALPAKRSPPVYSDEHEYPDLARARQALRVAAAAFVCGIVASQADLCPATWFIWSYLLIHLVGVIFLTDYAGERGLLGLCAIFGLHAGVALSEFSLWTLGRDGDDSVGPWSILVFFSSLLYLHSFYMECITLPPDYLTSISLFFPMFPAFNAAVALSCAELFLEWRYFPQYKFWQTSVWLGIICLTTGQILITLACRTGERNFWASCRNMPEDEEKPEDFVGLEIPDRRIVQEGIYRWERHPAYLGAMLWGAGMQIALCNPVMLLIVFLVLWASLLYVAIEEEQELYDEFKGGYANYCALTSTWVPLFNSFLENAAFQREMTDNCEEGNNEEDEEPEEEEEEPEEEVQSDDDLLPTWEGVPKGGALWNRQFRDPWILG